MSYRILEALNPWKVIKNAFIIYRGGIALVWLGSKNGNFAAMKQFPKQNN
jgi:hypothetical protein